MVWNDLVPLNLIAFSFDIKTRPFENFCTIYKMETVLWNSHLIDTTFLIES